MKQNRTGFCTRCVCIALAGIIITISSISARAQDAGCFRIAFDSDHFGPVFYGASATHTMTVTNDQAAARTISSVTFSTGDNSVFAVSGRQFPLTLAPHEAKQISVTFAPHAVKPDSSDKFRTKIVINSAEQCSQDFDIYGEAINPTWINTINPFDLTSLRPTLKFSGTDEIFGQTFLFQNTDTIDLHILSIESVSNDSQLVVKPEGSCSGLPMTAPPGELMAVRITLQTKDKNVHSNQLRFDMGGGLAPIIYNVEAQRIFPQSQASVSSPAAPELFTISTQPNPSSGNISIRVSGSDRANIEIFDAIGKLITTQKNISAWTWSGLAETGTPVPSGNYFIRATTHDASGKMIVSTQNVLVLR